MAIFSSKNKKGGNISVEKKTEVLATQNSIKSEMLSILRNGSIIKNPRITEKATLKGEVSNAYAFDVLPRATKKEIKKSIEKMYNVIPVKINTARIPDKQVSYKGKIGVKSGGKKAYVYLKKGDKIEFV